MAAVFCLPDNSVSGSIFTTMTKAAGFCPPLQDRQPGDQFQLHPARDAVVRGVTTIDAAIKIVIRASSDGERIVRRHGGALRAAPN
jgi:hypothetical protein